MTTDDQTPSTIIIDADKLEHELQNILSNLNNNFRGIVRESVADIRYMIANAAKPDSAEPWKYFVDKAVEVLQRHVPPDGLSDRDAMLELYDIFDGPEFRATGIVPQMQLIAQQAREKLAAANHAQHHAAPINTDGMSDGAIYAEVARRVNQQHSVTEQAKCPYCGGIDGKCDAAFPHPRAQPLASTAATQPEQVSDAMVDAYLAAQRAEVERYDKSMRTVDAREACRAGLRAALAIPASTAASDPMGDKWHSLTCDGTCKPLCAAASEQQAGADWINDVVRDVAELPDRDSPADQPDMMLVTVNELHDIIGRHAPAALTHRATTAPKPCDCCDAIREAEAIHGDGPVATTAADQPGNRAIDALDGLGYTYDGQVGWLPPEKNSTLVSISIPESVNVEFSGMRIEAEPPELYEYRAPEPVIDIAARIFDFKPHKQGAGMKKQFQQFADEILAAYAPPDVVNAKRLDVFIDWYLRGAPRSEVNPYGHMERTTRDMIMDWLDSKAAPTAGGAK